MLRSTVLAADFSTLTSRIFVREENLLKFGHEEVERTLVKRRAGAKVNDNHGREDNI